MDFYNKYIKYKLKYYNLKKGGANNENVNIYDRILNYGFNKEKSQVEIKAEAKPKTEIKAEAKPKTEIKAKSKTEIKAEAKPKTEIKAEVKPKAEIKAKSKTEIKAEAKPKIESKTEMKTEAKPKIESKTEMKTEAKPKIESKTEMKTEPKIESKTEMKTEMKPEPKVILPIFELYQYNIVKYPNLGEQTDKLSFTNIKESTADCPTFSVQNTDTNASDNKESMSLCDVITDEEPSKDDKLDLIDIENKIRGLKLNKDNLTSQFYKYLYYVHRLFKPKYFDKDNIEKFKEEYKLATIINKENITDLLTTISSKYTKPTIQIVNANITDKFIIIGDFHGSVHSFIRILFRLHKYGVLDITTMKLKTNFYLVFLGDIIDRGMFSTEILVSILLLKRENDKNVIIIAGNHEASYPNINSRDGFQTELNFKYNDKDELYNNFNALFSNLPVAVLVHNNGQTIWLSHGCFNASVDLDYKLNSEDYNKKTEIVLPTNNNKFIINSILWSDIAYDPDRERGAGDYYKKNTRKEFRAFMDKYKITGVIRGHQDNYSNSIIYYHNNTDGTNYKKINELASSGICNEKQICFNKMNADKRTNGPIARVVMSTDNYASDDVYQPVITISTATDMKKSLVADSFGLLSFNIDNINDFTLSLKKEKKLPEL